ncbi:MAG: SMP-30/gluconolactonase/LRE family protein [Caldilineaceae bacterium]|nr:SMP-30/gluconolactonase/LRE family protein [Caldilineaceae bacterium]MCY4117588.1 SMP-30/gluconolactonase/LRE family protein [Caldilineaceae bacterium]MDE0181932.1 SMP-30/gluconolactonase/LRE family protein [Caldilineaceae bacterium]MDE0430461.1 SMP-30/gluconolactonase/LRE family protein [Caldilineaceae bacterium]
MAWHFEVLLEPIGLTEGPVWDGRFLFFTNIVNSRIFRYDPEGGEFTVWREGTNEANGLMLDANGVINACEGGGRRMVQYPDGGETIVLCADFEGSRLNSPNDLAIDSRGRVWFTDPRYGDFRDDMELDHESVYRLDPQPDGSWSPVRVTYDTTAPNGLLLSPDEETLYVAQSKNGEGQKRELWAYPIVEGGPEEGSRIVGDHEVLHNFYPHRGVDGMCLDVDGNIVATAGWGVSGPGGMIYVFAADGRVLETHPVPCDSPTNCAFAGPDLRDLYVTSTEGHLLRARTDRQGLASA